MITSSSVNRAADRLCQFVRPVEVVEPEQSESRRHSGKTPRVGVRFGRLRSNARRDRPIRRILSAGVADFAASQARRTHEFVPETRAVRQAAVESGECLRRMPDARFVSRNALRLHRLRQRFEFMIGRRRHRERDSNDPDKRMASGLVLLTGWISWQRSI